MFKRLSHYQNPAGQAELEAMAAAVLLVELGSTLVPAPGREFRTTTERASWIPPLDKVILNPGVRVAPIVKSAHNPYASFIFVGRGSSSDIVLRRPSVSKTHAVFERDADSPTWRLRDHHSHNGTWLRRRRLRPDESVVVGDGDLIIFGTYPTYLVTRDALRSMLTTLHDG